MIRTNLEDMETDLDEELIHDNCIIDEMKTVFQWNDQKINQFVEIAKDSNK